MSCNQATHVFNYGKFNLSHLHTNSIEYFTITEN